MKYDLYGSRKEEKVEYEVVKLPLQDYVSYVRKFVSKSWRKLKAETAKVKDSKKAAGDKVTGKSISFHLRSQWNRIIMLAGMFKSIGIQDTAKVLQAGSITTAALVGVVLARRKSWFHRVLYPTLGGAGVWAIIYYYHPQNRANLYSQLKSLQTDYLTNRKSNK